MLPHQQRVVDEEKDVSEKFLKLEDFFLTKEFEALDNIERDLLSQQHDTMREYRSILRSRIERFTPKNRKA